MACSRRPSGSVRTRERRTEDTPLPDLYQRYAGHDNNRDSYMLTQFESQYLARVLYRDWLPEVYLDQHQMGSGRARIFVPPYTNPPNPNIDPLVWSETNLLGQAMAARLHEAGKPGVLWGEIYSGFWQGANSTNPWWHNMVGLLSEVASARLASPLFQQRPSHVTEPAHPAFADDEDEPMSGDAVIPPPADLQPRMNYPQPWLGGRWTFADVVDYHHLAAAGLLEAVAGQRAQLVRGFAAMNRRTIDRFSSGGPFAFIVAADQHDAGAAAQLIRLVQAGGGRVQRATAAFVADDVRYPAGTTVIPLAQPFGRWIKDLLEAQSVPGCALALALSADRSPIRHDGLVAGHVDGRHTAHHRSPVPGGARDTRHRPAAAARPRQRQRIDLPAAARVECVADRHRATPGGGR